MYTNFFHPTNFLGMGSSNFVQDGVKLIYSAALLCKLNTDKKIDRVCRRRLYYHNLLRPHSAPQFIKVVTSNSTSRLNKTNTKPQRSIGRIDFRHYCERRHCSSTLRKNYVTQSAPEHGGSINRNNLVRISTSPTTTVYPSISTVFGNKNKQHTFPSLVLTNAHTSGLRNDSKFADLRAIATTIMPDIVCVTESWLNRDINDEAICLPSYYCSRSDRKNREGGGICIYTKMATKIVYNFSDDKVNIIILLLSLWQRSNIIFCCIYVPPDVVKNKKSAEEFSIKVGEELERQHALHKTAKIIVCGDFNHLDISNVCSNYNLMALVDFATRGDSILDQIYTNIPWYVNKASKAAPLGTSDHCCVFLQTTKMKHKYNWVHKRKITSERKRQCQLDVALQDWSEVQNEEDSNKKAYLFQSICESIFDKNCPIFKVKVRDNQPPWLTSELIDLIQRKNKAYKTNKMTYTYLRNKVTCEIRKSKRNFVNDNIRNSDNFNTSKWWKFINTIDGKPSTVVPDPLLLDNEWVSKESFPEVMNNYYISVAKDTTGTIAPITNFDEPLETVPISTVKQHLKTINVKKSSRNIPAWFFKDNAEDFAVVVTDIINSCLTNYIFPDAWKSANITAIEKERPALTKASFRPISILDPVGKVAEKIICDKYSFHARDKIKSDQHAYVKQGSTTNALISMINNWTEELDKRTCIGVRVLLIDLSKAFDKMSHPTLLQRLTEMKFHQGLIKISENFLHSRKQTVTNFRLRPPEPKTILFQAVASHRARSWALDFGSLMQILLAMKNCKTALFTLNTPTT